MNLSSLRTHHNYQQRKKIIQNTLWNLIQSTLEYRYTLCDVKTNIVIGSYFLFDLNKHNIDDEFFRKIRGRSLSYYNFSHELIINCCIHVDYEKGIYYRMHSNNTKVIRSTQPRKLFICNNVLNINNAAEIYKNKIAFDLKYKIQCSYRYISKDKDKVINRVSKTYFKRLRTLNFEYHYNIREIYLVKNSPKIEVKKLTHRPMYDVFNKDRYNHKDFVEKFMNGVDLTNMKYHEIS